MASQFQKNFIIISDLPCALKCSKVTMYADDTSLANSAKDAKDITSTLGIELENLNILSYMVINYL